MKAYRKGRWYTIPISDNLSLDGFLEEVGFDWNLGNSGFNYFIAVKGSAEDYFVETEIALTDKDYHSMIDVLFNNAGDL